MQKGGLAVNERTAQVMRFAGLVTPLLLFLYGVLIKYGLADGTHYSGDLVFFSLMLPWVGLAFLQFLYPSTTWRGAGLRFALYHLLSATYVIFIAGFTMPFIATWILLFLASYAYFSSIGLRLSVLFFVLTAEVDCLLHINEPLTLLTDAFTLTAVLIVGVTAVAIARIQEIDGAELSRTKALESLQRDRILTIVNNLADAVLSTDEDGVVRVYNAACLNLLDTNISLNGHHIDEVVSLFEGEKAVSLYDELKKSRSVVIRDDLTMTLEDETLRLEVTYSPIRSSYRRSKKAKPQDGYIIILRDVTKAKSLEEERDEFISVVSHELRTPITITEGTISNVQLMMQRGDIPHDVLKEAIDAAHDQVIYLSKMVNDLSTLSRAERGVADAPETIEVRGLVDDLYKEYAPQAEAKKLHFNLDLGTRLGEVNTSRLYLKELLQNFVTNAIP
jgi:signal transduction histidine kinase